MLKKLIGWVLVAVGVLLMGWGVWSSYKIFTGKAPVPEVFEIPLALEDAQSKKAPATTQEQVQQQIQKTIQEQLKVMLPPDVLTKGLNLASWSIFMFILFLAGGKIAGIGIGLLK